MKRFRFPLERVLQLRAREEDEAGQALLVARRLETEAWATAREAARDLAHAAERLAASGGDGSAAGEWRTRALAVQAARRLADQAETAAQDATRAADARRVTYDAARQARHAIDKLKESRHDAWRREVDRQEQDVLDEVALRRRPTEGGEA